MNAALLYRGLRQRGVYVPEPGWAVFSARVVAAMAVMGALVWMAAGPAAWWLAALPAVRAARLAGVVALGGAAYFATLWALGFRLRDFSRRSA